MGTWTQRTLGSATVESLTAAQITTGVLQAGTTINVGDPAGVHTELGQGAVRILRPDSDGNLTPTINMGGAERDVIQIVDPDTGSTVAGFSDDGSVVGQEVLTGALEVAGTRIGDPYDPTDLLWEFRRPTTGYMMPVTAAAVGPTAAGTRVGAFETSTTIQGGRFYRVELIAQLYLPDDGFPTSYVALQYTLNGSAPTVSSPTLVMKTVNWISPPAGRSDQHSIVGWLTPGLDPDVWYTLRCLATVWRRHAGATTYGTVSMFSLESSRSVVTVSDEGPAGAALLQDGRLSGGGGTAAGGAAPAPVPVPTTETRPRVSTYNATWGRTWRQSGSVRTDVGPDLIQGRAGTSGSTLNYAAIGFPAQIQTDLADATVSKIEVYLYANHWWGQSGTAVIGVHGSHALPASFDYSGTLMVSGWKRGIGRWVTLPSTWYPGFVTGANRGITLGGGASTSTAYYGKFHGYATTRAPKLRISYTK